MTRPALALLALAFALSPAPPARAQCTTDFQTGLSCSGGMHASVLRMRNPCAGGISGSCTLYGEPCTEPSYCENAWICTSCEPSEGCDGGGDESACGGGACENFVSDPVHVGVGAFVTEPAEDVRFAGSDVPITFTRRYTSRDGWTLRPVVRAGSVALSPTRLSRGWFHEYDERLFAPDGASDVAFSWGTAFTVVHRGRAGAGRTFACTPPASPGDFACATADGSLDALVWAASEGRFRLYTVEDVARFEASGRLVGHAAYAACPRPTPPAAYAPCALAGQQHWTAS